MNLLHYQDMQRWQPRSVTYALAISHACIPQIHSGPNFSAVHWMMQAIDGENNLKHMSAQKMNIFNN